MFASLKHSTYAAAGDCVPIGLTFPVFAWVLPHLKSTLAALESSPINQIKPKYFDGIRRNLGLYLNLN